MSSRVYRSGAGFLALVALLFFFVGTVVGQKPARFWQDVSEEAVTDAKLQNAKTANRTLVPSIYRTLQFDRAALEASLSAAPPEFSIPMTDSPVLEIPMPDGTSARFHFQESPIMEPELATKFPEIKTYVGQGIDDRTAMIRFDLTPRGFHAMILSANGTVYIDPYWRDDDRTHLSYFKLDYVSDEPFKCLVDAQVERDPNADQPTLARPTGATLKRYRLALACTGEYATRVCSPAAPTKPATLAAMVTSVNRVSGIYEREVSIRFLLIANTDALIYLNGTTDPYTNNNGGTMLSQNQTTVDSVIGSANYDFGHVFSTGGGGIAGLGVICNNSRKAQGVTGRGTPIGDPFDVDYVAHEMGHQFDGNHTFNSTVGSCDGGNRNQSTAYETGSGITIQAYAGICDNTDLAANSVPYFHTGSYTEIDNHTTTGGGAGCASSVATGNNPPVLATVANTTIPVNTPFALTGSATDADGDALTYSWEQIDAGTAQSTTAPSSTGTGALFRSYSPIVNPTRVFPSLVYILNHANVPPDTTNGFSTGEILPTVGRAMKFRLTARDNRAGGGGANWTLTTVTTSIAAGPFNISSFNSAATFPGGSIQTLTWNVANSNLAPVNCANVKISLSTDGGNSFPVVLLSSTTNDGSQTVTLPYINSPTVRFKVEAVGNIFFDISNANTTISSPDTDGDGVPDAYESASMLNPNDNSDGPADADGDGATNYQEFIAGTGPNDRASTLRILSVQRVAGSAGIDFTTVSDRRYRVQAASDLVSWTTISGEIFGTGSPVHYDDPAGGSGAPTPPAHRFYRALVLFP